MLMTLFTDSETTGLVMTLDTTAQVYSETPASWLYSSRRK